MIRYRKLTRTAFTAFLIINATTLFAQFDEWAVPPAIIGEIPENGEPVYVYDFKPVKKGQSDMYIVKQSTPDSILVKGYFTKGKQNAFSYSYVKSDSGPILDAINVWNTYGSLKGKGSNLSTANAFFVYGLSIEYTAMTRFAYGKNTITYVAHNKLKNKQRMLVSTGQKETLLYGVLNEKGEEVIPVKYRNIWECPENRTFIVYEGDNQGGVLDENGAVIIPLEYYYIDCEGELYQVKFVETKEKPYEYGYDLNLDYSLFSKSGKLITKAGNKYSLNFKNSALCPVQIDNGLFGFMSGTGEIVLPAIYTEAGMFREGLAPVKNAEGRWGYIDAKGELVIPYTYTEASEYMKVTLDGRSFYIDSKGKEKY